MNRIETEQPRLENSTTNTNQFLMLNNNLNKQQKSVDEDIGKVEINRDNKLTKNIIYDLIF